VNTREMSVHEAVRELRRVLGQSQQAFASGIGVSIRSVASWENDQRPGSQALEKLRLAARSAGDLDLVAVFARAVVEGLRFGAIELLVDDAIRLVSVGESGLALSALNKVLDLLQGKEKDK
jgi:transcriptional regulator with XRE-family HTH domain